MMPATFVTIATFLVELCTSSPVYNMQPAFITNTVGVTSGRNIRHLPCISRKSNQKGVCMFAIDCLKANGTHLGTCIDRFYFGSCCHIEPPKELIDNEVIDKREPPLRVSSTTQTVTEGVKVTTALSSSSSSSSRPISGISSTTTTSSTARPSISSTTTPKGSSSVTSTAAPASTTVRRTTPSSIRTTIKSTPSSTTTTTPKPKPTSPLAFGDRIPTTTSTVEETTLPVKLQTFQVVDGVPETTSTWTRPVLSTTKRYSSTTAKLESTTSKVTTRPKPTVTTKPSKPTKPTAKPTKPTTKPTRTTTTKKPQETSTKASTTVKITKKPVAASTKPTKKPTTTTPRTTSSRPVVKPVGTTSAKPILTTTSAQVPVKITTKVPVITSTKKPIVATIEKVTIPSTTTTKLTTSAPSTASTTSPTSTTISNELSPSKLNVSQLLETVSGNPATNEIEAIKPIASTKPPTSKPVVSWTVADDKNRTSTTTTPGVLYNATTEDWVPITTPDYWVLLPSVPQAPVNDSSQEAPTSASPPPLPSSSTEQQTITTASSSTTSSTSTTEPPKLPVQTSTSTENVTTVDVTESASNTEESVLSSSSTEESSNISSSTTGAPSTTSPLSSASTTEVTSKPINMSDFTDVCGRRMYPSARIVGGEDAAFGEWPWQISLRQWRTSTYLHKCGAALLNENWAITAAHCVENVPPSDLLLRLGEHDLSTQSEPYLHEERRVQIVAKHPQFDNRTFEYDLALLRFYEPVDFRPNILPVCVPHSDEDFIGRTAYVTGWGRLYEDGPLPSVLQKVSVPVINNTLCEQMYRSAGYIEHIPHIFICAGWRRGGFDSCEGDSGGPMVIQREDRRFVLAGVISWGIGCAEPNQPGVYTRISEFRHWINQILQF